jgi:hypothetical protein
VYGNRSLRNMQLLFSFLVLLCKTTEWGVHEIYRALKNGLQALRGYSTHSNEQKCPGQQTSRNQCLLRYGWCSRNLSSKWSTWFPCISTQLPALRRIEVRTLSTIHVCIRISWQTFSARCSSTSKSSIGAQYTKAFMCRRSQKPRGDRTGQMTGPPRPIHRSPKVWLRCCLAVRRKWGYVPSCMNHMCCRWRGTCPNSTGEFLKKTMVHRTC